MIEWIQLIVGMILMLGGLFFVVSAVVGNFRFGFVLSRMQAAAMGDTCGILLMMLGLAVMNGLNFSSVKMLVVVIFQWIASPISSHMLVLLELNIGETKRRTAEEPDESPEDPASSEE